MKKSVLDHNAESLRGLVQDIVYQMRKVEWETKDLPDVELSIQELRVIEFLGEGTPRKMSELADYLVLAVNSVTSTVDNLERKGLVRRTRTDHDRRVVRVELTEAGRTACDACIGDKTNFLRKMLAALTEDEQEILIVLFRKIARAGHAQVDRISTPE